ncbi:MAG: PDC sensor domain-containing protein [Campylobacterota bacterium]|nr:PDC sensor domain-containing protein [Campylobacterota bacterium]
MQEFMEIYKSNADDIENFLIETIKNTGNLSEHESHNFKKFFDVFPSLELVYIVDEDILHQTSANIYRDKISKSQIGTNRTYLLKKIIFDDDGISISQPYVSSATGETCITVAKKENGNIYFLDFNISLLLQRLGLVEVQKQFNFVSKAFYFITANMMILLALFAVGYSFIEFISAVFFKTGLSIESIFKPVIALTLGLAIFDLAKTILEQEVVFKSYSKNTKSEYKVLIKFSITIIIALLIESLMVVFKIAIDNYEQMINAVYLIGGVSILFVALGLFIYFTNKK